MATFPNSLAPSAINMGSQSTTLVSKSHSGKRQARKVGTTLLTFDVSWTRLDRAQMGELWGFVQAQSGQYGVFWFSPALYLHSSNPAAPDTAEVAANAAARQKTVALTKLPANKTLLNTGDLIRFQGHAKTYVLAAPLVSDANGTGALTLAFDLIASVDSGSMVYCRSIAVQVSLVDDSIALNQSPPFWHDLSLKLIETI
ncbi:MAG: hypothetical protein NT086_19850 [Proteobacteria bacterium]|nr:hypothetical protein [Pseudomonadota bacterium]